MVIWGISVHYQIYALPVTDWYCQGRFIHLGKIISVATENIYDDGYFVFL